MNHKQKKQMIERAKKVLEILKENPVGGNGISIYRNVYSSEIEKRLNISDSEVRGVIRFLRRHNYPIGAGSFGYRYCTDIDDWEKAKDNMRFRYHSIGRTLNEMKRVNFHREPELFDES